MLRGVDDYTMITGAQRGMVENGGVWWGVVGHGGRGWARSGKLGVDQRRLSQMSVYGHSPELKDAEGRKWP